MWSYIKIINFHHACKNKSHVYILNLPRSFSKFIFIFCTKNNKYFCFRIARHTIWVIMCKRHGKPYMIDCGIIKLLKEERGGGGGGE